MLTVEFQREPIWKWVFVFLLFFACAAAVAAIVD